MDEKQSPRADEEQPEIKLNFRIAGRMPSVYAHHLSIQPGENEVVISFFEIVTPPLFGAADEIKRQIVESGVIADCVVRVTVANNRFPAFAQAFQQFLVDQVTPSGEEASKEEASKDADNRRDAKKD